MANPDLLNAGVRAQIISEIASEENKQRKAESLRRFEIYRERQGRFILEKLEQEFSAKTVREMRKILSINLVKRIIDEEASIYNREPERSFGNASEREKEQLENLYSFGKVNTSLRLANRYFKLTDQTAVQIIPKDGVIQLRPLLPHHYDVIPQDGNPEKAFAYILNILDKTDFIQANNSSSENLAKPGRATSSNQGEVIDGSNQKIGDPDDYKSALRRYIVWTDEFHFVMNGRGTIIGELNANPIGKLPFVDIAFEKDFEFFVRRGNSVTDFQLEFSLLLSDIAEINKLQGYAQAVMTSEKEPQDLLVGVNHILWMPIDPNNPQNKAEFQFVSPNPDMSSSLELLDVYLKLFLSARGVDSKTISGKGDSKSFSSGVDRFLSMIEKFEASQTDIDLFRGIEDEILDKMKAWSNIMQSVTEEGKELIPELKISNISDNVFLDVQYKPPAVIQTQTEKEDSAIKMMNAGLQSKSESIAKIREIDSAEAEKVLEKINSENLPNLTFNNNNKDNKTNGGAEVPEE